MKNKRRSWRIKSRTRRTKAFGQNKFSLVPEATFNVENVSKFFSAENERLLTEWQMNWQEEGLIRIFFSHTFSRQFVIYNLIK